MFKRDSYEDHFLIVYYPDKYITQKMSIEAVDNSLAGLKFFSDCLVTIKMIKKIFTALYADENILYFNEGFGDAVFNHRGIGILDIDLNNITLGNNFNEDDTVTDLIFIRLFTRHIISYIILYIILYYIFCIIYYYII